MKTIALPQEGITMQPEIASIGPFSMDYRNSTITLGPGTYILTEPVTLGMIPGGLITGVRYEGPAPLESSDAATTRSF